MDQTVRRLVQTIRREHLQPPEYDEISVQMSRGARAAVRRHVLESRDAMSEWLFRDLLVVLSTTDAYEEELEQMRDALDEAREALDKIRAALEPVPAPDPSDTQPSFPSFQALGSWHRLEPKS